MSPTDESKRLIGRGGNDAMVHAPWHMPIAKKIPRPKAEQQNLRFVVSKSGFVKKKSKDRYCHVSNSRENKAFSSRKNSCRFHHHKQMEADGKSNFNGVSACVIFKARRSPSTFREISLHHLHTRRQQQACKVARSFFKNPTNKGST